MPVASGQTATEVNLNDTTPAAPAGKKNVAWQGGTPYTDPNNGKQVADVSAYVDAEIHVAGITIDGGGSAPLTDSKGFLQIPAGFNGTIVGWTLLANASGSAQITVKKGAFADPPVTASIVALAPPLLSSQQAAESSTLTGWTTAVNAGDILEFNLDSISGITRLTLELVIQRT